MSKKKVFFEVDRKNKTFVFSQRYWDDIYNPDSEVYKALHAAMALGCYDGYIPVIKERKATERNTSIQSWNEEGIEAWIKKNNKDYLARWKEMKEQTDTQNKKFPFMVRKNLFLYENEAARRFCHLKEDKDNPYTLGEKAEMLKVALETK